MILDLYTYFRNQEREKKQHFEKYLWKSIEKDNPNATDTERKQIFLDWLYPKTTNDYEDLLND